MPDVTETKVCPKCGGVMEGGRICSVGSIQGLTTLEAIGDRVMGHRWAQTSADTKKHGTKIRVFACTQCGYMESYLDPESK